RFEANMRQLGARFDQPHELNSIRCNRSGYAERTVLDRCTGDLPDFASCMARANLNGSNRRRRMMSNLVRISIGYFLLAPFVLAGCGGGDDGPVIDRGKPFDVSGGATNPPKGSTEVAPGESQAVAYPEGPYGTDSGAIAPNLTFLGWKNPTAANYDSNSFEHVSFADFYDPDGSKGIKLLLINASAVWCGP